MASLHCPNGRDQRTMSLRCIVGKIEPKGCRPRRHQFGDGIHILTGRPQGGDDFTSPIHVPLLRDGAKVQPYPSPYLHYPSIIVAISLHILHKL